MFARIVFILAFIAALVGCSPDTAPAPLPGGPREFGQRCDRTEDCSSTLCIRADADGGICTRTCADDAGCPPSPNWRCVSPGTLGGARVCACRAIAAEEICGNGIDDDCNGKVDDCQICNGKPIPRDDRENCGACGNACRGDQICSAGACICANAADRECSGACADLATDAKNCGACGTRCPTGQSCVGGACKCPDSTKSDLCAGGCVDLKTDPANCGTCGTTCVGDQVCRAGACVCPTTSAPDLCGTSCIDLATSNDHCGKCGTACPTGTACTSGSCECPTTAAPDYCAGTGCVNKSTDRYNCGSCGRACSSGQYCASGVCTCSYGTLCGTSCVNTMTDSANCGACGTACTSPTYCIGGTCQCPGGGIVCAGNCSQTSTDPLNCGACGNACRAGERCAGGVCTCDSGLMCSGVCVPVNDRANCGACGNACGGSQYCNAGTCVCTSPSLAACGASCVDLNNDSSNCGACGATCPVGKYCSGGRCVCGGGTSPCGEACVALSTDTNNCGACGKSCRTTEICSAGACVCPAGSRWCDSAAACVNTSLSNAHCGACDAACPTATGCVAGVCKCTDTTKSLCSGICRDLAVDSGNCGSCGNVCTGTKVCKAGACMCDDPLVASPVRVTNAANDSYDPSIASNGTKAAVVYLDKRISSSVNAYLTLLESDGTLSGVSELALTTYATYTEGLVSAKPRVVWAGTRWVVIWGEVVYEGGSRINRARVRGVTTSGALDTLDLKLPTIGDTTGVAIAYDPTFGCAAVYGAYLDRLYFQKLGPACDTPATPVMISPGTIAGEGYGYDLQPSLAIAPTGEYGVLSTGSGSSSSSTVHFIRFNADGSRTKSIPVLKGLALNVPAFPTLAHDGTTWLTVLVEQDPTTSLRSMVVARGENLETRTKLIGDTTSTEPLFVPRFVLNGSALELLFMRRTPGSAAKLYFGRYNLPGSIASAPTALSRIVEVVGTNNVGPDQGLVLAASGGSLLATWSDNRWGAYEIYTAAIDRRSCP